MTSTQPDMNRPEPDSPEQLLVPSRPRMDSAALAGIAYSLLGGASLLLLRTIPMPSSTGSSSPLPSASDYPPTY